MKVCLFALGLALCCAVQAEWRPVTSSDMDKAWGTWYNLAVATNSDSMLTQLKNMPIFVANLTKTEENKIRITVSLPMPDGCKTIVTEFRKTEDGKFCGQCENTTITLESALVMEDHALTTIAVVMPDESFRSTTLHSRTAAQNPEMTQKFIDKCRALGYSDNQIMFFDQKVVCR